MGGLDGIDIILLDRTMLLKPDVELVDYHFQHEHYPEEIKVEQSKKKRAKEYEIMINVYPTLSIQNCYNNSDKAKTSKYRR